MVGAILNLEMMLGSRRSRAYIFRWLYAALLVVEAIGLALGYWIYYLGYSISGEADHFYITSFVSENFVHFFVTQQMILLLLAAPVLTAGAITEEKTTGTLQYLFTTDLHSWHIVAGKMTARTCQVAILILTGFPMLCFLGAMGGIEPVTMVGVMAITVMPMVALGSASLLASVWFKQTRDAVLALYAAGGVFYLAVWLADQFLGGSPLNYLNPHFVLEPVWGATGANGLAEFAWRLLLTTAGWGGLAVVCLGVATWRLRPAYVRQLEGEGRKKPVRWWRVERAAIGPNPITWKERHVEGLAPAKMLKQIPTWLALVLIFFTTTTLGLTFLAIDVSQRGLDKGRDYIQEARDALNQGNLLALTELLSPMDATPLMAHLFSSMSLVTMLLASLLVGIRCSGTITGEREKKTWEALLLTPLTTKEIVGGKMWGIMGSSYLYLLAYAVPALGLSTLGGLVCFGETAIWLGVTWLAMYFVGAAGVWCSVRARGSWRSLLGTLGVGYVGGGLVYGLTTPFLFVLAAFIAIAISISLAAISYYLGVDVGNPMSFFGPMYFAAFRIASCLVLAGLFALLAWYFSADAVKWVADRERTRHWHEEKGRSRARSPARREPERQRFYR